MLCKGSSRDISGSMNTGQRYRKGEALSCQERGDGHNPTKLNQKVLTDIGNA
jgi:hypothetical protein